jgi:large subunit ribosomal protein L25
MSEIVLNAELRDPKTQRPNALRRKGLVPGVYYAHGETNLVIATDSVGLKPLIFTSQTNIVMLKLPDGTAKKCILRDIQIDPVTERPVHFDLQGLREDEELMIEVPVVLTGGIPKGVRDGGSLQQMVHRLRISCLPRNIPSKVEINVGELGINEAVHVKDLKIEHVTILESAENAVVGVLPPTVVKEAEEVAAPVAEAAAEPEVVGKGKKPEEGAEAAEPKEKEKEKGKEKEKPKEKEKK